MSLPISSVTRLANWSIRARMAGYSLRGGRMLTTDNYECTWDLYKSIPSLNNEGKTVFDETVEFNEKHKGAVRTVVDHHVAAVDVGLALILFLTGYDSFCIEQGKVGRRPVIEFRIFGHG
jgi:hypothetical protein